MGKAGSSERRPLRGPSSEVGGRILKAARDLLARGGLEALTISALEAEAHVYSSAIHYHFGSKSRLVAALVEQTLDEARLLAEATLMAFPPGRPRIEAAFGRFNMMGGSGVQLGFYEMLGNIVRDDDLLRRARQLYGDGYEVLARVLAADDNPGTAKAMTLLSEISLAFLDGLIVQQILDPDADVRPALTMMEDMVIAKADEIQRSARFEAAEV